MCGRCEVPLLLFSTVSIACVHCAASYRINVAIVCSTSHLISHLLHLLLSPLISSHLFSSPLHHLVRQQARQHASWPPRWTLPSLKATLLQAVFGTKTAQFSVRQPPFIAMHALPVCHVAYGAFHDPTQASLLDTLLDSVTTSPSLVHESFSLLAFDHRAHSAIMVFLNSNTRRIAMQTPVGRWAQTSSCPSIYEAS